MKEKFPTKNTEDSLEKELEYCQQLISIIKGNEVICSYPKVQERLNLLEEMVTDDQEHLKTSKDEDAKVSHKTADTSFFGYKTHITMTEERIITVATITSGEKTAGKELLELVRKSRDAGMEVKTAIEPRQMNLNLIKMQVCISVKRGIWQFINILINEKERKRIEIHGWFIFSILKNVNVVLAEKVVIKMVQKKKTYTETISVILIVNKHNFKKLSILKRK